MRGTVVHSVIRGRRGSSDDRSGRGATDLWRCPATTAGATRKAEYYRVVASRNWRYVNPLSLVIPDCNRTQPVNRDLFELITSNFMGQGHSSPCFNMKVYFCLNI